MPVTEQPLPRCKEGELTQWPWHRCYRTEDGQVSGNMDK